MDGARLFERNIRLHYIISALMWGRFFVPVLALFYIASQVPLDQFAIIMSVFALATLIFEIPSGVLADILGKKKTLLISRSLYVIEIILIAFFNGFWVFLIAKIISGIGVSLSSGTTDALLYDSLKRLGKEKDYKKISGKTKTITNISMAVVFIIGAFMFSLNSKLPAYCSLPLIFIGFLLTFGITEPYKNTKNFTITNYNKHFWSSLREFFSQKKLIYFALYSFIIGSVISITLSLSAAYLDQIMIPVAFIGMVNFVSSLISAYSSKKADDIERKIGSVKSLFLIQFLILLSVLLIALMIKGYGILFLFIISFASGLYAVIISDYLNQNLNSENRTTMISINNFFENLGVFILFPIIGLYSKSVGLGATYMLFGVFISMYVLLINVYMFSKRRHS